MGNLSPRQVAALFDGCGFVSVLPLRLGKSGPTYKIRVGIWGPNKGICLRLKRQFGGSVGVAVYTSDKKKRKYYRLQLACLMAAKFIRMVYKYLDRRKAIAKAALRLLDTAATRGHWYPLRAIKRRERLYMKYLIAHRRLRSNKAIWRWEEKRRKYGKS